MHKHTHMHSAHTLPQPLFVPSKTLKICSISRTFYFLFSILHFGCRQEFAVFAVKDFLFWFIVSVFHWALCQIHLSLSLPFSPSLFQVRSTVNRIKERRKALNFSVCNPLFSCVCICLCVSLWKALVRQTQFSQQLFLFMAKNKNLCSSNANESWPQSGIVHLLASHQ